MDGVPLDKCCGPRLAKELRLGKLANVDRWECPKCGCAWKAVMRGEVRSWESDEWIEVFN
jgi:hypothetical protein